MPMTVLFLVIIASFTIHEIERLAATNQEITVSRVLSYSNTRRSWPMVLGVVVFGILAVLEIYLFSTGRVYKQGVPMIGFLRLFVLIVGISSFTYFRIQKAKHAAKPYAAITLSVLAAVALVATYLFGS